MRISHGEPSLLGRQKVRQIVVALPGVCDPVHIQNSFLAAVFLCSVTAYWFSGWDFQMCDFLFWGCLCRARTVREMAERHIWEMSPVATPKALRVLRVLKFSTSLKSSSSKVIRQGSRPQRTSSIYPMLFCTPCGIPLPGSAHPVLPKAAFRKGFQFGKIVGHIVLHGVLCRREQGFTQILLALQLSKAVFQRFNDVRAYSSRTVRGAGRGNRASWVSEMSK